MNVNDLNNLRCNICDSKLVKSHASYGPYVCSKEGGWHIYFVVDCNGSNFAQCLIRSKDNIIIDGKSYSIVFQVSKYGAKASIDYISKNKYYIVGPRISSISANLFDLIIINNQIIDVDQLHNRIKKLSLLI